MHQEVEQPVQGYHGGPYDMSLLTRYEGHVARKLWYGLERGVKKELKVASHGKKLEGWVPRQLPPLIEGWLKGSGLSALQRTSMKMVDANLLSAFVERWHPETSSFHMPFGEMTITLYDVACLLHIPIRGDFYNRPPSVSEEGAAALAEELLGVTYDEARAETTRNRGGYYRQEWLYRLFDMHHQTGMLDCAARAYMLLLVGCTVFTDKSFTLVEAKYLPLFRNLSDCGRYCWGAAALVTLYEHLGDGSMFTCKQLGGYMTLLQCWIHEYFPTLGNRAENRVCCDKPETGAARAMRWKYKQGTLKVDQIRRLIDDLTPADVIWRPFESHRQVIPFDDVCLYNGCLRWCDIVVPYLPERCLRQFGYVQYVPPPPPDPHTFNVDAEWINYHSSVCRVIEGALSVTYPFEVTETYMEWYYNVSHPRLICPADDPHRPVPVPVYSVPNDARPSDPRLALIASELQGYLDKIGATREKPMFRRLYHALDLARGGPLY